MAKKTSRNSLRLPEERHIRVKELRGALIAGEQSGPGEPFNFEKFICPKEQGISRCARPASMTPPE